ncbi:NAD-dependent epimerase/dehydratase family protein [Paenibacillus sp. YYML68]|uniref:NAD-dependent epimerase/dehydratase family protein n=1 Tax=Paenibacillus sp. YYML68 TaxID=2909250 RepID=UPI002490719F|nr:NAD-dependent epimerase/dehydratase family protein [Paenibacillus sp. YYML68]
MNEPQYDPANVYLITGAAGFIGCHMAKRLLDAGARVIGLDNMNSYYELKLKEERLAQLKGYESFHFIKGDISDKSLIRTSFATHRPNVVIHLAAQAGVLHSIDQPDVYMSSNVLGFYNVLEACRQYPVEHLIYASSSSVYGANKKVPFEETDMTDTPISLYASTKKSNELMAYTYSHLFRIPATGLRFFTVYGPMGRPDMSYYKFANMHFAGKSIPIYNNGDLEHDLYRDFTYIDDIVAGLERLLGHAPTGEVPHQLFNIGNNRPEKLMVFIETLERCLSRAAGRTIVFDKRFEPIKAGDVPATYASTERLQQAVGFKPETPIEVGLQQFADWYVSYHGIS